MRAPAVKLAHLYKLDYQRNLGVMTKGALDESKKLICMPICGRQSVSSAYKKMHVIRSSSHYFPDSIPRFAFYGNHTPYLFTKMERSAVHVKCFKRVMSFIESTS